MFLRGSPGTDFSRTGLLLFRVFLLVLGPIFGAIFGSQKWASNSDCNRNLNVRAKLVPKTGFKNGPVSGT